MPLAKLAAAAACLGGVLLVLYAVVGGGDDPLARTLVVLGMLALVVAGAAFGTTLVKSDATAMRGTVALASGLLVLAFIEAFRPQDTPWYHGTWGVLALLVGGLALLRGRHPDERSASGAHAR